MYVSASHRREGTRGTDNGVVFVEKTHLALKYIKVFVFIVMYVRWSSEGAGGYKKLHDCDVALRGVTL